MRWREGVFDEKIWKSLLIDVNTLTSHHKNVTSIII